MTSLDIVTVNWNSGEGLRECLTSVFQSDLACFETVNIFIVDNNSADGSEKNLPVSSNDRVRVEVVRNSDNAGFGVACNQGAQRGTSEYLLFLNPDVILEPNALSGAASFLAANPEYGTCGIMLRDTNDHIARCCARFPSPGDFYARSLGLDRLLPAVFEDYMMTSWNHEDSRPVDHVIGAFYFTRRGLFEQVGGFDESYFLYFEDLDLSKRIHDLGYGSYYLSTVSSFHEGGGASKKILSRRLFLSLTARLNYAEKHFGYFHFLLLVICTLVCEPVVRAVYALLRFSIADLKATLGASWMIWSWFVKDQLLSGAMKKRGAS